jgi:hypothetical protein
MKLCQNTYKVVEFASDCVVLELCGERELHDNEQTKTENDDTLETEL